MPKAMPKFNCILIAFLFIRQFDFSTGFKWVPLKSGDVMPENAIRMDPQFNKYVGRIQYYNTIQLAEIHKNNDDDKITQGILISYSNEVVKHAFEVLVATEQCDWVWFDKTNNPQDIARGGTAWNMEPIFVAKRQTPNDVGIASLYLSSNKILSSSKYIDGYGYTYILTCNENHTWVDATSSDVPENSVSAGVWNNGEEMYVARLLGPLSHVPGHVIPSLNKTEAFFETFLIKSFNNQVLIEDSNTYSWKTSQGGMIPDYAVACGISENNSLMYIQRSNQGIRYKVFEQSNMNTFDTCEILVRNVD